MGKIVIKNCKYSQTNVFASVSEAIHNNFSGLPRLRFAQTRNDNKRGFTLAEVLITLTIIGVIAALTIPNLMQRYQEHVTVNKVKKFYSTLTNAYAMAQKEYGNVNDWALVYKDKDSTEKVYELLIKPYFKISKDCGNTFCNYSSASKYRNGSGAWNYLNEVVHSVILEDGTFFWFYPASNTNRIGFYYRINPNNNASIRGENLFFFYIDNDKVYPQGLLPNSSEKFDNSCASLGDACTSWVIYKGNMDYLHCSDLSWNGKNKCQ